MGNEKEGIKGNKKAGDRPGEKKSYLRSPVAIIAHYVKPHKKLFIIDMVLSVLVSLIDLAFPYVSRWSLNTLLPENAFKAFFIVMAVICAAYILKGIMSKYVTIIGHNMGLRVEADMREAVFGHMEELSFDYYDKNRTGALLSRCTTDLFDIVELAHHGPENILICSLTILGALAVMVSINWKLGLILLVLTPVCLFYSLWARKKMQDANVQVKKVTGEINSAIESSISGIRVAKAFANEEAEKQKFRHSNDRYRSCKSGYYYWMGSFNGGMEGIIGLMQVVVVAAGGFLIMRGEMNYIDLITFTLYVSTFTTPVRKFTMSMEIFAQGLAGCERFKEVMGTEPAIQDAPGAADLKVKEGRVTYDRVSFSYRNGRRILDSVSTDILPGTTFALVGATGGGKTTFCNLLPRFYEVTEGSIAIDGTDIRNVTMASLRKNIGIIQQDVFLFADTIKENIRYGRPDATDEEVYEAAKHAEIYDEIMAMPQGFDSFVGERGIVLSGGQKQRVSIARVFLKDPPILILDEATSALDSVTERNIQAGLDRLCKGKTAIVIAHRLSTVRHAHCIAVVEQGRIIEQGNREELLKKNGAYAALERAQEI